jgi:D-tyrosyl-tRNA(Tyr) deacylase
VRALLQRVRLAEVVVDGESVGAIDRGVLVFLAIQKEDEQVQADRLLDKLLAYRIFPDENGLMNLSLQGIAGGLLIVSQFTLAANTRKGLRPSFSSAAPPDRAEVLYDYFVAKAVENHPSVAAGLFGADMQVHLINDGPVTFLLEI